MRELIERLEVELAEALPTRDEMKAMKARQQARDAAKTAPSRGDLAGMKDRQKARDAEKSGGGSFKSRKGGYIRKGGQFAGSA